MPGREEQPLADERGLQSANARARSRVHRGSAKTRDGWPERAPLGGRAAGLHLQCMPPRVGGCARRISAVLQKIAAALHRASQLDTTLDESRLDLDRSRLMRVC